MMCLNLTNTDYCDARFRKSLNRDIVYITNVTQFAIGAPKRRFRPECTQLHYLNLYTFSFQIQSVCLFLLYPILGAVR